MDLYPALAGTGVMTHLTENAETTLCGLKVLDLPQKATMYCVICVDTEYELRGAVKD